MISKYFFLIFFACNSATMIASDNYDDKDSQVFTKTPEKYKKKSGLKRKNHEEMQPYSLDSDPEPAPLLDLNLDERNTIINHFMSKHAALIDKFQETRTDHSWKMKRIVEPYDENRAIITVTIFHSRNHQLSLTEFYTKGYINHLASTNHITDIFNELELAKENSDSPPNSEQSV